MQKKFEIDTYAVMGNPIAHSKTPFIHKEFAKQTGKYLEYLTITPPLDGFAHAIRDFQQQGGKGLNIAGPFKQEAWRLVNRCSDRAQLAEAVTTILFENNGELFGDNTDGVSLIRDITHNHHYSLQGKKILILGAGGAAQGILAALLAETPEEIFIANRTPEKATALAQRFSKLGMVNGGGFDGLLNKPFDVIINASSASLKDELPPFADIIKTIITAKTFCYDMAYGEKSTIFVRWAKDLGVEQCFDGLGMLAEHAAATFYLWHGIRPNTQPVIKMLRELVKEK